MYCSNCGKLCAEEDHFCSNCGNPLSGYSLPKKGSLLVPILIMVLLCFLGIILYFGIPLDGFQTELSAAHASWFRVKEGVLYFESSSYNGGSELTVPTHVNGQTVLSLADGCFENCDALTSVELPDTLESIGIGAFRDCNALRGIRIPESVKRIGSEAFFGCSDLEAITLSSTLETIGADAFDECNQLHYIMFSGFHRDWIELYDEFINPYSTVFCVDGSYYQGAPVE